MHESQALPAAACKRSQLMMFEIARQKQKHYDHGAHVHFQYDA